MPTWHGGAHLQSIETEMWECLQEVTTINLIFLEPITATVHTLDIIQVDIISLNFYIIK